MPKIVSRSAVSTSTDAKPTESSAAALRVYYCICGEFVLVIDKNLELLPRRKTDNAIVIRCRDSQDAKARVFKLNVNTVDPILIDRGGKYERQYRFQCTRCTLPIGYQCSPLPLKSDTFLYIYSGALTQQQGQVPTDAFEEEH